VIGCEDRLRNDLTVSGGVLNSTQSNQSPHLRLCCLGLALSVLKNLPCVHHWKYLDVNRMNYGGTGVAVV